MRGQAPFLAVVGGFLGAGKTTLILAAARELARRGLKAAVILNDQGDALVDTQLARHSGLDAGEVTGGCFCCQFADLITAAERLRAHAPDVIFAEPVGSCTDLAATVLLPLREAYPEEFRLTPLTVCVDPLRAREIEAPECNPHLAFLFRKQLAEADLVCFTKSDLRAGAGEDPKGRYVSARTGQGVAAWLDEILSGKLAAGGNLLEIDYDEYARAEAALAWMNLSATVECEPAVSPAMLLGPLLDRIAAGASVVHLKATDQCETGYLKAALTGSREDVEVEGALDASPATQHRLLVNLRAAGDPATVREVVEAALLEISGKVTWQQLACFTPGAPQKPGSLRN